MNQFRKMSFAEPIEFHVTRPSACSYREGRVEQRIAAEITRHAHLHDSLAKAGFRRVENWIYRPICQNCNACKPIRIPSGNGVDGALRLSRSQQRTRRRNADLTRRILPNYSRADHYALFRRYLEARHGDGQMVDMDEDKYADMVGLSPIETVLVEYRLEEDLVAVILVDVQADGLSAVYSFFDPGMAERSLGTFMVLDLADITFQMNLPYVYLGYFVHDSAKMKYKARFTPAELLEQGEWVPFSD